MTLVNETVTYNIIPAFVHILCTVKAQVSSSPDAYPMVHKNDKFCNFLRQFLPR